MTELNDKELDTLLSALTPPLPPPGLSQRIMAASAMPPSPSGLAGLWASIFGSGSPTIPLGGAWASLVFGVLIGYLALPDFTADSVATDDEYLYTLADSDWDNSFEDLLQ